MREKGFTLVELLVVVGILGILLAVSASGSVGLPSKSNLDTDIYSFIADVRAQQTYAMNGKKFSQSVSQDAGIFFETNTYTLFHGTYSPGAPSNFVVTLPGGSTFTQIGFASNQLIFAKVTGDILSFNASANSVTITDPSGVNSKTITFNRYGVYEIN